MRPRTLRLGLDHNLSENGQSVGVYGVIQWSFSECDDNGFHLLPATALAGACYLVLVDVLARVLSDSELPLGILTAVVGVPVLLWLLRHPSGGNTHDAG
ncbi:iron chelate uptake ABC transporter family permease subunit [Amycolatopsis sp. H20-H5]|uniref:iron chelate uptake ABC transporter family permease subunit n=1 Tax=Amycolatopsis sp. H20-H5 TaxID=3046309 RepID=UPI002DBA23B4|nr:iron chelate uptake ABC transporter family permease subunit [Amycolatopsis sp. H20-H5]MEC3976873.1 iron chelate uptake ABC transporter family permease subunit [Amycolatopsis sp. H20-H5]